MDKRTIWIESGLGRGLQKPENESLHTLMVAGTNSVTPHASLTGKFFSVDEHSERLGRLLG